MDRVPAEVLGGVRHVGNGGTMEQNPAVNVHIGQFLIATGQSGVQRHGSIHTKAIVHPVAGFDDLDRLIGGGQLLLILGLKVHNEYLLIQIRVYYFLYR